MLNMKFVVCPQDNADQSTANFSISWYIADWGN